MYVTVSVLIGFEEVLKWTMYKVQPEYTFSKLLEEALATSCVVVGESEHVPECYLSNDVKFVTRVKVSLEFLVMECCEANGKCVRYIFSASKPTSGSTLKNAAEVLMSNAKKLCLPNKIDSGARNRGDIQLYNDIIQFMMNKSLGFHPGTEQASGRQIIVALQKVLFYIQPHLQTLNGRKANFVPVYFQPLLQRAYNNPSSHGHSVKPLERSKLETLSQSIFDCLSLPIINAPLWSLFKSALEELSFNVVGYVHYLESNVERVTRVHRSPTPMRSPKDGSSSCVRIIHASKARKPELVARYLDLESMLSKKGEYLDPVFVNDFAPSNSQCRYLYFKELLLPFNCELYSYAHGNNLGSLWFIWRIPSDLTKRDTHKAKLVIDGIEKGIEVYHTREMQRQFSDRYHLLAKTSQAVLKDMYQYLTGDVSSTTTTQGVQDRLKFMLDSQDPDVWFDLRSQNSGQPQKYEEFWKAVDGIINENALKAVDSRRHGTVCHMALALSVRDLRDKVLAKYPTLAAPGVEWLRYQFSPQNEYKKTAMRYTGRLNIKYMIQSRQLNFDHPDSHYTAAIFKYMREFSIKFRNYCDLVCIDDKHCIKCGEPGYPVAAVDRGKQVLVATDKPFIVADHDFTKTKITPSVSLVCDIPMSIEESFYCGRVFVSLKDSVFQPSSPFRHGAELYNLLQAVSNPILCLYSDGGPDHRVTYLSVQLSLICLFRALDLDYLIAARTAPHNSFRNPVERIMSLLNIGLQAVGIMREAKSDEFEAVLKKANSMEEIRKIAAENEGFKETFLSSMSQPIELIKSAFSSLNLKGSPVQSLEPASEEDIEKLFAKIIPVDSSVQMNDTHSKDYKKRTKLQEYMNHCCVRRKYFFCIRKCGVADCAMCLPPKLPPEIFQQLHFFPDPMKVKDSSESFLPFKSVYGNATSEKFRPSLKLQPTTSEKPFRLAGETVTDAVVCGECLKPRCVYSIRRLTQEEFQSLAQLKEDVLYVCGGTLFPETSDLSQLCCVEPNINCNSTISVHYFSCRKKFDLCCYSCGSFGDLVPIEDERRRKFQTIHPVCSDCKENGITERTRGPRFTGQKRKKRSH